MPGFADVKWEPLTFGIAAIHCGRARRRAAIHVSLDTIPHSSRDSTDAGELVRITQPVRVELEICEIADRVMKSPGGGQALLFEHVMLRDGSRSAYPVAINLFGSMTPHGARRSAWRTSTTIGARITELLSSRCPKG